MPPTREENLLLQKLERRRQEVIGCDEIDLAGRQCPPQAFAI